MPDSHLFISHASTDDPFVKELRLALESHGLKVWVDSRNLRGGGKLAPEISQAIEQARQTIVVLSPRTINSPWVRREIRQALAVEQTRKDEGYRVIPLMLPGIEPSALEHWFDEEPVGIKIELKVGSISEALPQILAALGERLPTDYQLPQLAPHKPVEELLVKLSDPKVETLDGKRRASAMAELIYEPSAYPTAPKVESRRFNFTAPLGPIEADDLRWYLEEFYRWPSGVFRERAERVEASLPAWGKLLFDEAARSDSAKDALNAWRNAADGTERRFSVQVDNELPDGASKEDQAAANEAASLLLSLPWELLHDGRGFLFRGKNPVRVRRRLPNRNPQPSVTRELPIRILLVSPRPEEKGVSYLDHRVSAKPLVEAVEALGDLAKLTILRPPTFAALQTELTRAAEAGQPYDVVHFDGHGVYDRQVGLGGLCFEDPKDADKLEARAMQLVYAKELAGVMRDHRIPLVFLEACQSAQTEENPSASVAASLLTEGVTSVVAMSHSVLVETARRFVKAFYEELAKGARVGSAMLAGQRALQTDSHRGKIAGAGELRLQDWFVPVLYQEAQDPRLVPQRPSADAQQVDDTRRRLSLGRLPLEPPHSFIGRSRELLRLERLLLPEARPEFRYAVVRGVGGEGKTTLAAELARWLVATNRFERAAFVSFDPNDPRGCGDPRSLLDSLGQQLLPEGERWSVAEHEWKEAVQHVERALRDHPTILVLDNLESIFPSTKSHEEARSGNEGQFISANSDEGKDKENLREPSCDFVDEIFSLCQTLLRAQPATRIVFTSREALPAPFDHPQRDIPLGQLSREDAVELVRQVLRSQHRSLPEAEMPGGTAQAITDLVETANRHARALVRLTQELTDRELRSTTEDLRQALARLDRQHPDDRENSLYASVELSLRRLPPDLREQVKALAVFHGGASVGVLKMMQKVDEQTIQYLANALIDVGLANDMGYGYLRLDPALPIYLLRELSEAEAVAARARWAEAMWAMLKFLAQQRSQDSVLAQQLALLELPNLTAVLAWLPEHATLEAMIDATRLVEELFSNLGRSQVVAQAMWIRQQATQRLSAAASANAWSHAHFQTEDANISRLLERGQVTVAYQIAQQLLSRSLTAGEQAYPGASFHIATAHFNLGLVLQEAGNAEAALLSFTEAQRRFQVLADSGEIDATKMLSATSLEKATCLRELGRLDEAAEACQEAVERNEKIGDPRGVAIDKVQLATVRLFQKSYGEALKSYQEALPIFESLNEPLSVAILWHQIGMAHRQAGQ
ncbi:MAG TPA: CHAT domain-containing protein, partial [Blastocatellia bacterium]